MIRTMLPDVVFIFEHVKSDIVTCYGFGLVFLFFLPRPPTDSQAPAMNGGWIDTGSTGSGSATALQLTGKVGGSIDITLGSWAVTMKPNKPEFPLESAMMPDHGCTCIMGM